MPALATAHQYPEYQRTLGRAGLRCTCYCNKPLFAKHQGGAVDMALWDKIKSCFPWYTFDGSIEFENDTDGQECSSVLGSKHRSRTRRVTKLPKRYELCLVNGLPQQATCESSTATTPTVRETYDITLEVGCRVLAKDIVGKWLNAVIVQFDNTRSSVLVHFDNWDDHFNEWIGVTEQRLRDCAGTDIPCAGGAPKHRSNDGPSMAQARAAQVPAPARVTDNMGRRSDSAKVCAILDRMSDPYMELSRDAMLAALEERGLSQKGTRGECVRRLAKDDMSPSTSPVTPCTVALPSPNQAKLKSEGTSASHDQAPSESMHECLVCFEPVYPASNADRVVRHGNNYHITSATSTNTRKRSSARITPVLQCTACSANPYHRSCAPDFGNECPQCRQRTVIPWVSSTPARVIGGRGNIAEQRGKVAAAHKKRMPGSDAAHASAPARIGGLAPFMPGGAPTRPTTLITPTNRVSGATATPTIPAMHTTPSVDSQRQQASKATHKRKAVPAITCGKVKVRAITCTCSSCVFTTLPASPDIHQASASVPNNLDTSTAVTPVGCVHAHNQQGRRGTAPAGQAHTRRRSSFLPQGRAPVPEDYTGLTHDQDQQGLQVRGLTVRGTKQDRCHRLVADDRDTRTRTRTRTRTATSTATVPPDTDTVHRGAGLDPA